MAAFNKNFVLEKGTDYKLDLVFSVKGTIPKVLMDITGWTADCQHRANADDSGAAVLTPAILYDVPNSTISLVYSKAQLSGLTSNTTLVYDVEITRADGSTFRAVQGSNLISAEVTK